MTSSLQHLPRRDIERLSAYLDGELSAREQEALKARLEQEPKLRAGLEDLRSTVSLLRGLPAVKAPRNYLLSPEMAGVGQRRWTYPALQLATAVATFAFLIVIGVDILTSQVAPMNLQAPRAAAPPMVEEVAEEAFELQDAGEMDEAAGTAVGALERELEEEEQPPAVAEEERLQMESAAEPEAAAPGEGAQPTVMLAPTETATATAEPTLVPSPEPTATVAPTSPLPSAMPRSLLRITEIGLAALVVGLALATFRMRLRRP